MGLDIEVVEKNDPEEEPAKEEEDEEEVDLIDPADAIREDCSGHDTSQQLLKTLEACTQRVSSRNQTAETCHEEMLDWVDSVEHCVSHSLFSKLK